MKNVFVKRILPIALCVMMLVPMSVLYAFAANESLTGVPGDFSIIGAERANWSPNGQGYHSSVWNNDRHSKYLNNGTYNHSYQWWEPTAPERPNGAGVDPTKQYFGFSFEDGYYFLDEIQLYVCDFDKGTNNIKYRVEALILGEWVEIGVGYQDDGAPASDVTTGKITRVIIPLSYYRCSVCDTPCGDTWDSCRNVVEEIKNDAGEVVETKYCGAKRETFTAITINRCTECGAGNAKTATECSKCGAGSDKLESKFDINTNNIRVWCSEYGYYAKRPAGDCDVAECKELGYHVVEKCSKAPTKHDWWLTPKVQEVELMGYTGYRPIFDVPLNAYLVRNAALSGMIGADSSVSMYYPGLAGDELKNTYWRAMKTGAQNVWAEFNDEYPISKVGASFGGCESADVGTTLTYNIKLLLDGTIEDGIWETVVTNQTVTTTKEANDVEFALDNAITAKGMMIEITSAKNQNGRNGRAIATELLAEIANGGKCIFLAGYITTAKKLSTATGNIACYGAAYASSNFAYAGISKVSNLIDGNISYADDAWIALNYDKGTYAGVTLREPHEVTKVVLYFDDVLGGQNGEHIFKFNVQIKVGEVFKTVATATSYDAVAKKYIASVEIPNPEMTDDVRIEFISDAQTFPYLKEIEIFDDGFLYSSYDGYMLDSSRKKGGPAATEVFADRTVAVRSKYFDKISPIEYFNITLKYDIEIDWLSK